MSEHSTGVTLVEVLTGRGGEVLRREVGCRGGDDPSGGLRREV